MCWYTCIVPAGRTASAATDHVRRARSFARTHLSSLLRRSGESYAAHGEEIARALSEITDDASLRAVAHLHDVLIHPEGERLLRTSPLTAGERELVRRMHTLRRLHIDEKTKDLDTVIAAFSSDERLLPLRMAHRLNDVRHLARFAPGLRRAIARETLHMYTAIAGRLGMYAWRYEMEDLCFSYLYPTISKHLRGKFLRMKKLDDVCLRHARTFLLRHLREKGIDCDIDSRIKGLYSTYRKMSLKRRSFEEITDRLALRIIVSSLDECYLALSIVHARMHPIPGKLKDYIGAPKENGYRSIHTVVFPLPGVTEQPLEIQIRTRDMHDRAEHGVASHCDYKHFLYSLHCPPARVHLFRNLESLREESRSPQQFAVALRQYFRDDHVPVFDVQNNLFHLKRPATVLDFLCLAKDRRLPRLKGVRVNGRMSVLHAPLHDGDTVEPFYARTRTVAKEWLSACRHARSRRILRSLLRASS